MEKKLKKNGENDIELEMNKIVIRNENLRGIQERKCKG
jgi:hypothetical protein